jgi:PAS domain S-box-containing protein
MTPSGQAFGPDFEDALGKPVVEVLPHLADFYAKILADAFMGRASSFRDFPFDLRRKGERKKAWFDLDFTPIVDARGSVQGILVACPETTVRVEALLDARTSHERLDLALEAGGLVGTWEVDFRTDTVRADERFARLHGVDPKCAKAGVDKKLLVAGIHAEDRDRVMAAFDQAKISGTYRCEHRVVGFDGTRWIVASGHVRHGPDMAPTSFAGTAIDVTEQVETAAALAESERLFRTYAETLPQIVYSWKADGSHSYVNHRWHEFIGLENGDPGGWEEWASFVHPDDKASILRDFQTALASGGKYENLARHRHHSGEYRWLHGVALPIHDNEGRITSWIGTLTDVHDAKLLETERELVSRELDHRIRNFFALAQGLVNLTARESPGAEDFAMRLSGRLAALHEAHDLVRPRNEGGRLRQSQSLHGLISRILLPYGATDPEARLRFAGDDLILDPGQATAFALVFHELATNAAKYGALSNPEERLQITTTQLAQSFQIIWRETGSIAPPPQISGGGFGSRLMTLVVERQLSGHFNRTLHADCRSPRSSLKNRTSTPVADLCARTTAAGCDPVHLPDRPCASHYGHTTAALDV